jgi:hypothetical protein
VDKLLTYTDALAEARENDEPLSILLGNGFSIGYDADAFSYRKLLDAAEFAGLDKEKLFEAVGTEDFERAIDALQKAAKLTDLYGADHAGLAASMHRDAEAIRKGLSDTISRLHPDNGQLVKDEEIRSAGKFLSPFYNIFTLNYDLLLYWVIIRSPQLGVSIPAGYDGFRSATSGGRTLIWTGEYQFTHYLHGAMHLFMDEGPDGASRLIKLNGKDGLLMDQVRSRIARDSYPHVVTEGSAKDKVAKISDNDYLGTCLRKLIGLNGRLFLYGVGLNENDLHIARAIAHSNVTHLYAGIHGTDGLATFRERAAAIIERRNKLGTAGLQLTFYDASAASPWQAAA